jgi:SM-20-related protein
MIRPPFTIQSKPGPFIATDEKLGTIAADVAARDWGLVPDFLDAVTLAGLREEARARRDAGRFRAAAVGRASGVGIRPELRSDLLSWIEPDGAAAAVNAYLLAMEGLRQAMNRRLYLGLAALESQFALYPPGTFYRRHLDRHRDSDERILSCVLYLNENWVADDGGQLRLYLPDDEGGEKACDVSPAGNRLVVFLSDRVPHEVLPARRERLSIASWFRGRPRLG